MSYKAKSTQNMLAMYPGQTGDWVGIAFRTGDSHNIKEDLIMGATWGPYVHSEFILGRNQMGRAYSAFDNKAGFSVSNSIYTRPLWTILTFPLREGGYHKTYSMILQMLDLKLPYNSNDLWQCCVKLALPFETELDCEKPTTWHQGVFCSQVSLLLLRRMARANLLDTPSSLQLSLENVHSRGCSPNMLFGILQQVGNLR